MAAATPPGQGGIGVVRLSGPASGEVGARLCGRTRPWPARSVVRCRVDAGACATDALITFFQAPASFTGDDVLEIAVAGNPLLLAGVVERAVAHGARVAGPGEFTFRAYANGKLDLVQAEALRDLVQAVSPAQLQAASSQLDGALSTAIAGLVDGLRRLEMLLEASVDFPDEGYRFIDGAELGRELAAVGDGLRRLIDGEGISQRVREGVTVVLSGSPNVGKSSLFNALLGSDRAIVTPVAGTTRDLVSERLVIDGCLVRLVDSAGLRDAVDLAEEEGVRRAERALAEADVSVLVLDGSRPLGADEVERWRAADRAKTIVVVNKADLAQAWAPDSLELGEHLRVSAVGGTGVGDVLRQIRVRLAGLATASEDVLVTSERHRGLLREAVRFVERARREFAESGGRLPEEFVLEDLRGALTVLSEVTGRRSSDELLHEIFSSFCIGK
ncbi:MAG: tRNA uridine-5-carboxymethylaminomethyl(34) synthesis GTPase MnmE [Vicinamibacterales bacterium]